MSNEPITRSNLLSALESMQSGKSKRQDAAWWVAQIKEHKVDFHLTVAEKRKIHEHGSYLGTKGLDSLIAAIRQNPYKRDVAALKKNPTGPPSSVNQVMTNSPGGIQAARDVNIYHRPPLRILTDTQKVELVRILKNEPSGPVDVTCIYGNEDSENYAHQFFEVLQSEPLRLAGWKPTLIRGIDSYGPAKGLTVRGASLFVPRAVALRKALSAIHLDVEAAANPKITNDRVIFVVGLPVP